LSKDVTIGIDLGTSCSCVCAMIDGKPTVLATRRRARDPSVVAFHEGGKIEVGNARSSASSSTPSTRSVGQALDRRHFFSEEVRKARAVCKYEIVPARTTASASRSARKSSRCLESPLLC
jgi:molecular chaperone DnaK (HSP70)